MEAALRRSEAADETDSEISGVGVTVGISGEGTMVEASTTGVDAAGAGAAVSGAEVMGVASAARATSEVSGAAVELKRMERREPVEWRGVKGVGRRERAAEN